MKKLKILLSLLVVSFTLTGCLGSLSDAKRLAKSNQNMDNLDNYSMKMIIDFEIETEGMTVGVKIDADSKIDAKNLITEIDMDMEFLGMNFSAKNYTIVNGSNITTYTNTSDSDEWYKETAIYDVLEDQNESVANIISVVTSGATIEKKSSNREGSDYYVISLNKESVEKLLKESNGLAGDDLVGEDYEIIGDLDVDVYINSDNYITFMEMDLSDVIKFTESVEGTKFNKMKMSFEFGDYNKLGSITIPQSIIDTAIEE
jgi:hypothetical protein